VDGSGRLQSVSESSNPRYWSLIRAFERKTGVPVLLNTSFNLAGEPIVNRAIEGYSTFRRSGIDVLVAGRYVIRKQVGDSAAPLPMEKAG
jgi:carbamoyltransferase